LKLYQKVRAVEKVFNALDQEIKGFQTATGLGCLPGCGKCCFKADIEATPLEFLPFAYRTYKEGTAFVWLEKLQENKSPICVILNPFGPEGKGNCSQYNYRGLICRLFGFSARRDKYGAAQLVTCNPIRTEQSEKVELANRYIADGGRVSMMNNYYMQLHGIDMELTRTHLPINKAMQYALEHVITYYSYRSARRA
jgi:Fe-S-cluster containining protein